MIKNNFILQIPGEITLEMFQNHKKIDLLTAGFENMDWT